MFSDGAHVENIFEHVKLDQHDDVRNKLKSVLSEQTESSVDIMVSDKHGSIVFGMKYRLSPVAFSQNVKAAVLICDHIYASDPSSERFKDQLEFTNTLLETIPCPVFFKDRDGKYLGCNRAFEEFIGKKRMEIVGRDVYGVSPEDIADKYFEKDEELFRNGGVQTYEWKVQRSDGEIRDVVFNKAVYNSTKERSAGLVGVILDITERKSAEERLKQALKEKQILMKELVHRTKNNMASVIGLLQLQAGRIKDKSVLSSFEEIKGRIHAMMLVQQNFYQNDDLICIDLKEYLHELANTIFHNWGGYYRRINLNFSADHIVVSIDTAIPCGLVLNELMTNAFKYAFPEKDGGGSICISLSTPNPQEIVLRISDNGVGVPEGIDIHNTDSLGMALVSAISREQLKGTFQLEQTQGKTEFILRFKERQKKPILTSKETPAVC